MSMLKSGLLAAVVALGLVASLARAEGPGLGVPISESDIAAWDLTVFPSGANLPPGSGTAAQGAPIYAEKCALCHGVNAEGGIAASLVGGEPLTTGIDVVKTVANFWASATTLFDFTRRQMPWQAPRTLTDDEVYALTAYILALNDIIDDDDVMNAKTLPAVRMPNRDGFMPRFPELIP
jgi:S-disulfanyl-L-cysteine oxidoreductase SoxD